VCALKTAAAFAACDGYLFLVMDASLGSLCGPPMRWMKDGVFVRVTAQRWERSPGGDPVIDPVFEAARFAERRISE
jgi:hypothetical protein